MLQVYLGSSTIKLSGIVKSLLVGLGNKVYCYLATRPEVESNITLSIVNSKAHLHLLYTRYAHNISLMHHNVLNTRIDSILNV